MPGYRSGWMPRLPRPLPAPYSITVNLYRYLRARTPTLLYDWREERVPDFGPGDVILGHPHPNPKTVMQRALYDPKQCSLKALIFPMHHGIRALNEYALPLLERCDLAFGIMGEFWYASLNRSFLEPWMDKIVRLDMAVDVSEYPWIKRSFNPPNRRGYIYIGTNLPEKGPEILSETVGGLEGFRKGWIGDGPEIPGIPRISAARSLDPPFMAGIAKEYDIFVNTSISDANPTTILESMAWGFPVACTPQSGYWRMPNIVELSIENIDENIETLRGLQYASENRLLEMSKLNRELVTAKYTWEQFCSRIWAVLQDYV